jgi:hypothetical protein
VWYGGCRLAVRGITALELSRICAGTLVGLLVYVIFHAETKDDQPNTAFCIQANKPVAPLTLLSNSHKNLYNTEKQTVPNNHREHRNNKTQGRLVRLGN